LGLSHKKSLAASEQLRSDIMAARDLWINRRSKFYNKALPRLVFLDETSTNSKLTKRTGWAPRGKRYRTHAPFGSWKTQTFIAALRNLGLSRRHDFGGRKNNRAENSHQPVRHRDSSQLTLPSTIFSIPNDI